MIKINNKQMWVLVAAAILFSLSALFPPWVYEDHMTSGQYPAGYHFLYNPPRETSLFAIKRSWRVSVDEPNRYLTVHQDLGRLSAQRIAIPFLTIGLLLLLSTRRSIIKLLVGGVSLLIGAAFTALLFILP